MSPHGIIDRIRALGGSVRYGFSGWLGGVTGLSLRDVKRLVASGDLVATREGVMRKTRRSRGLPTVVTTYSIARPGSMPPKKTPAQLDREIREITSPGISRPRIASPTPAISPTSAKARVLVVEYDVSGLDRDEISNLEYAARAQGEGADGHPASEGGDAYSPAPVIRVYTKT